MDFDVLSNLGWREGLMAVAGLLAIYVAIVYWRMHRLRRVEEQARTAPLSFSANSAVAAYSVEQSPEVIQLAKTSGTPPPDMPSALGTPEFQFPWNEPPAANPQEQRISALEIEVDQLRREVGGLRAEVLLFREAKQQEKDLVREESRASVTQLIAPQYSEAMELALKEVDPAVISQQCGITRAEAELVAALVRNRDN